MKELDKARKLDRADVFRPLSQLLQGWIEGGFLSAIFFLFLGYQLAIVLNWVILSRQLDYLTPLYSFLLILSLWHLLMSPYGGGHRLAIALSIALLCSLKIERTN